YISQSKRQSLVCATRMRLSTAARHRQRWYRCDWKRATAPAVPDIGPDHPPLVAGLSWAVKLKSKTPFQGRAALDIQTQGFCRARRFNHRSRDRAAGARNHLSRRQVHRLSHEICGEACRLGVLPRQERSCAPEAVLWYEFLPVDGLR